MSPLSRLDEYLVSAPEWAVKAFHNDSAMHRSLHEAAHRDLSLMQAMWFLVGTYYEQRNTWMATAEYLRSHQPIIIEHHETTASPPSI
jgi:hypothetical protein